jgi:c-di-GMP-binding flagellar brake protein YcgR
MERRAYPRVEVSQSVLYFTDFYPKPTIASTLDLCLRGTKIESLYSLSLDEGVGISIAIQPKVIEFKGKVIHVVERENGRTEAGIQFREMSEHDRLYLRQYLFHVMEKQAISSLSSDKTPV